MNKLKKKNRRNYRNFKKKEKTEKEPKQMINRMCILKNYSKQYWIYAEERQRIQQRM